MTSISNNFSYNSALSLLGFTPESMLSAVRNGIRNAAQEGYDMGFQAGMQAGMGMQGMGGLAGLLPGAGDLSAMQGLLGQFGMNQLQGFTPGVVPQPEMGMSGPPAGKGLTKNPPGFPEGSVRTAGGYTVVPDGNTNWKVFGPDQKPGDKPITSVHGDPHVDQKDGKSWDFSKSSDFVLPDGTRIGVKTSAESGHSVTTGLDIANGADHVAMTGMDGKPQVSNVMHDGYEWRAQHLASDPNRDTFKLGGDGDDWFMQRGGQNLGEVTGAHFDSKANAYVQNTDGQPYRIDPNLKPPFGSEAWGNMLRNESIDFIAGRMGLDPGTARQVGQMFHAEHSTSEYMQSLQKMAAYSGPFGGLMQMFDGPGAAFKAVGNMSDAFNSLMSLNQDLMLQRQSFFNV